MTMNSGLYRIELNGLPGGSSSGRPAAIKYFRSALVWLPFALVAGLGTWVLVSGYSSDTAESEPVRLAAAVASEPVEPAATGLAEDGNEPGLNPATIPGDAAVLAAPSPLEGLKLSSQSWRRGGLGSKALVTFTLRNANDYAVKDVEIACAFTRRDGSHLTDRKRVIPDTVNMKSRKTFARLHVGFVNVHADKAKCSLLTASRA